MVEGKERALSSTSSCSNDSRVKEELNTSIKLDESYLQKSQLQEGLDAVDSPLNRMESLAVDSPLSEQSKIDDIEVINGMVAFIFHFLLTELVIIKGFNVHLNR